MKTETIKTIKQLCNAIWSTYGDEYGYASEKIEQNNKVTESEENVDFFFGQFDIHNQAKLIDLCKRILPREEQAKVLKYVEKLAGKEYLDEMLRLNS